MDSAAGGARVESAPASTEQRRGPAGRPDPRGPALGEPSSDRTHRRYPDRDDPFLAAFAEHAKGVAGQINIVDVEPAQFAHPQRAGVQQLENRLVPKRLDALVALVALVA